MIGNSLYELENVIHNIIIPIDIEREFYHPNFKFSRMIMN